MTTKLKMRRTDPSVTNMKDFATFSQIGGLSYHISVLKEQIIFPLIYAKLYTDFQMKPPRGVLFYGPPGTGKTLIAGAIARECNKSIYGKVTFFHRKGADILDKWVGESEQKLRSLFKKAAHYRPSIIFFDEIDGLAPVRSSRQDQVHASVVATLLSLMDGLDSFSGVVVIGATNRLDAIDPALRRPGRFDKEMYFPLPNIAARREILQICVKSWNHKPSDDFFSYLADITPGYSGSDLQALCSEAVLACLRRNYPKIHNSVKVNVNIKNIQVNEDDFLKAKNSVSPLAHRLAIPLRRLTPIIRPLLQRQLDDILIQINNRWPHFMNPQYKYCSDCARYLGILLLVGGPNQGQSSHIAPAILHAFEHLPSFIIDIQTLFQNSQRTAEEICVQYVSQARQSNPAIVLVYRMDEWWDIVEESTRAVLTSLFGDSHSDLPILIIATVTNEVPLALKQCFARNGIIKINMANPTEKERRKFLYYLFIKKGFQKFFDIDTTAMPKKVTQEIYSLDEYSLPQNGEDNQSEDKKMCPRCNESELLNGDRDLNKTKTKISSRYPSLCHVRGSTNLKRMRSRSLSLNVVKVKKTSSRHERQNSDESINEVKTSNSMWSPINKAIDLAKIIHESITSLTGQHNQPPCDSSNNRKKLKGYVKKSHAAVEEHEHLYLPSPYDLPTNVKAFASKLEYLYKRAYIFTTNNMTIGQLEAFYDMIHTCMSRENQTVVETLLNMEKIMKDFENKNAQQ